MLTFQDYRAIVSGVSAIVFIIEICACALLPNRFLAQLAEKFFGITRTDRDSLIVTFNRTQIDLASSRRFRLSLAVLLATIGWIYSLLLIDGCVMQVQHLSPKDACPSQTSACFVMGLSSTREIISCSPGEKLSNITSAHVVCFVWIYSTQNVVSVLNQLGICSSVYAIFCHVVKGSCRLSHKRWGLVLCIILAIGFVALSIIAYAIELRMSITAKLLSIACGCLLLNIIQLFQFTHLKKSRVSSKQQKALDEF